MIKILILKVKRFVTKWLIKTGIKRISWEDIVHNPCYSDDEIFIFADSDPETIKDITIKYECH